MNSLIKIVIRTALLGIIWTFVLSITWQGRPIFYYANDLLVQNEVVDSIDRSLADAWERVNMAARSAWSKTPEAEESVSF